MNKSKLNIVWICHFSDARIRGCLEFSNFYFKNIINRITGRPVDKWIDFAVWNSNAIKEFENFENVKLTVIFPHQGIKGKYQSFSLNRVDYICFRSEDDHFFPCLLNRIANINCRYSKNRKLIANFIKDIRPDIVHVIGAENPYYSLAAVDIPKIIPSIVSLQTLMSTPDFLSNYPIDKKAYLYRSGIEKEVIKACDYIGTTLTDFRNIIKRDLKPDAQFLDTVLAIGVDIDKTIVRKEYDFVYFAANINKAADYAIEVFAIAQKQRPSLTLNISGSYSEDYKKTLDDRIKELGIENNVFITGPKDSHEEVLNQIKKSRFALLPLKIDMISSTIRESMACGLPVVTTKTPETPYLNINRESVMLSDIGDFDGMANNMIRLVDDDGYQNKIRNNAFVTVSERYSNYKFMNDLRNTYYKIISRKDTKRNAI